MTHALDTIRALCAMLGRTHGWTGGYGQLKKRRVGPICNCPQCDYEDRIAAFRYFSIEPATGQLIEPRTLSERLRNKDY